jgi:hypothetical protein
MLALSLILIGVLLRFVPHAPNFAPIAAIALFGGAYLNKKQSFFVPLLLMIASDAILGLHNTVAFTWGSFALIALLGYSMKQKPSAGRVAALSLASSLLFYVITNFGVWLMGWYPRTAQGLVDCYVMALPFLRDFTAATVIYSFALFGTYELIAKLTRDGKLASVLLKK